MLEADLTLCTAIEDGTGDALARIEALADRVVATAPPGVMIRFDVRPGPPSAQIVACARELGAAQIVVGRTLPSPEVRLAHAGVCTALLHEAACPLLVAGPRRHTRRILVATDLTVVGAPVLRAAALEACRDDSAVTALHCVPQPAGDDLTAADAQLARTLEDSALRAERCVAAGPVARAIVEAATSIEADLIILGSHAHSTAERVRATHHPRHRHDIGRILCGTIADRVARAAPCSVLLVPIADAAID